MNHNFKLKLVALMATLSGTAVGSCQAMQADASSPHPATNGIVRPAEPAFDGAFGAVTAAKPLADYGSNGELPPIVSPGYAAVTSGQQTQIELPPIVTPDQTQTGQAPLQLPTSQLMNQPAKKSGMLSPLSPLKMPAKKQVEQPAMPMAMAPAPVIQASSAPVAADGSSIQQAQWGKPQAGYSAGGVPIYQKAMAAGYSAPQELPPIVQGDVVAPSVNVPSIVDTPMNSVPMPPIISADSQVVTPMNTMVPPVAMPMNSAPMMNSAPAMDQTYFSAPPMEAPVISSGTSGCNSCGGGGCTDCGVASSVGGCESGCGSCGPNGCFSDDIVSDRFGACGSVYSARRYMIAEVLYFNRDDGLVANSNFGALNSFDGDLGWRFTIGNRSDATRGREVSYFGTTELEQSVDRFDAGNRINSRFVASDGFGAANLSSFNGAFEQSESKDTEIHSLEYNKVRWGWDVVKSFVGLRYIYVEDNYRMFSRSNVLIPGGGGATRVHEGLYEMNAHNNLFGPHIGGELFYDVGYRLSWSLASKAGVYANFNKLDTRLRNDGTNFLNVEDENGTVSGSIELNLIGHYQLSQQARFRFGYNALWLGEVASVSDNFSPVISPTTGSDAGDSDDMFFHGVSLGLEIFR